MFRYNKTIDVPYMRQGMIYFWSHNYAALPEDEKRIIRKICKHAGGEYSDALMAYMTTATSAALVCIDFSIERSHLFRLVRHYYIQANEIIN